MSDPVEVVLARIETKLDRAISDHEDHEKRIRKIERIIWKAFGASSATGALLGAGLIRITGH